MEHALGNIVQGGWGLGRDSRKQLVREKGVWPDRDRPLAVMRPFRTAATKLQGRAAAPPTATTLQPPWYLLSLSGWPRISILR